jgi:Tol biopolymer transport system component
MTRRTFVKALSVAALSPALAPHIKPRPFLFKVRGSGAYVGHVEQLAMMNTDGAGLRILDFHRPNETGFGIYDLFRDGHRAILMSIEMSEDWKTKPFNEYYPRSRTHIWTCDLRTDKLTEIATKGRLAPFYAPCLLLPGEKRILVSVVSGNQSVIYSMNLDGTDAVRLTDPKEFVYGVSASPDGKRIAFHADYRIYTMDADGRNRVQVAGRDGWIYFGTSWSPDGKWVLYQTCHPADDPGHDWSDIWIGRPDGTENIALTEGFSAWFASSYGAKDNPGNGSIMPRWAPDGSGILYARRLPGSVPPWQYNAGRVDTNHFNRDYKPELARGGAAIYCVDPHTRKSTPVSHPGERVWDFRPEWSPDSMRILFTRAPVGENPAIWIVDRDGSNERYLTNGRGDGADFARWLPYKT